MNPVTLTHLLAQTRSAEIARAAERAAQLEPTTSHHLKQLLGAGLVSKRRDGMNVYYRLAPQALDALSRVLDTGCC